ncbi:MAG TPA: serine/threonine-protein kinase [Bacteroidota bacterium]|nr:serine/threonine-protein kinase [Bacteroidota bacterium]
MNQALWHRVREVFGEAYRIPAANRAAFLDKTCGADAELRGEVASLLAALDQADAVFQPLPQSLVSSAASEIPAGRRIGSQIGSYRIVRLIASGGMGEVYEAARDDGKFQRRVAIKFVRSFLSQEQMIRRFDAERSLLASLQHPNIAQLIDAGSTDEGTPYLIMEFVDGERIDEYCDARQLSIAERLRIFQVVCGAVRFAHQHLVVHRDIKAGNILVDAGGIPKLLDFGIAKLLTEEAAPRERTLTGLGFMTPDYASPEQLRGEQATTISDVYSLGMLLYKLLTGRRPYDFRSSHPFDISQAILDSEPTRPSGKPVAVTVAGATPEKVRKTLSGDIDAIVLMALRKEPEYRYQSVQDLSDDIGRFLANRPVFARKGEARHRAAKFIRRHRSASIATLLVCLALIGGVSGVLWQTKQAEHERDIAQIEAQKAKRINGFLRQMISESDKNWYNHGQGPDATAIQILDAAADRLENELQEEPAVKAELHMTIGNTYLALGKVEQARHHFSSALQLRRTAYAASTHELMESEYYLAGAYEHLSSVDTSAADSAESLFKRVIDTLSMPSQRGDIYLPYAYQDYSGLLLQEGRIAEAESCIVRALPLFVDVFGEKHVASAACYNVLGHIAEFSGDCVRAEKNYRRATSNLMSCADRTDANVIESMEALVHCLISRGAYEEADSLLRRYSAPSASLTPYEGVLLARLLCCGAWLHTIRGELGDAEKTVALAKAAIRKSPENEIRKLNVRELIDIEEGRLLIARGWYSHAREILLITRTNMKKRLDHFDHIAASCDALLKLIPRENGGAERTLPHG